LLGGRSPIWRRAAGVLSMTMVAVSAMTVVGGVATAPVSAATTTTAASFDSEAGDYIGQGQQITFPTVVYNGLRGGYPTFTVSGPGHSFQVWFAAPTGSPLTPGTYEDAQRFDFRAPGYPGLDVFGDGRGCNTVAGRFVVDDATYDASGNVLTFSARFEDHCEGAAPALFGVVSYNSTAPYRTRSLSPTSLSLQSTNGAGASAAMTITNNGPATLSPSVGSISGANASDFVVTGNTCPGSLASGASCEMTVTYTPSTGNPESAQLAYSDELAPLGSSGEPAGAGSGRIVTLSGTAVGGLARPYKPVSPTRICDTRPANASVSPNPCNGNGSGAGTLGPDSGAVLTLPGLPAGTTAVVLNVTVTDTTAASFLDIWPDGQPLPNTSDLDWTAGKTVANLVEVTVGSASGIDLYNLDGNADVVIDFQGYVGPAGAGTGLFNPLPPTRICDTRAESGDVNANQCNGEGAGTGTVGAGGSRTIQVTGEGGVPSSGVSAVVLNVTVTDTTQAGYLTVWPAGATQPLASNLDWVAGDTVPNRVIVPVGSGGQVTLYNSSGSTDVVVDVGGWFTDNSNSSATGASYVALSPTRICDTRAESADVTANQCNGNGTTTGTLTSGGVRTVQVTGLGGVPSNAVAVVANVTVTDTSAASFLTVYPDGTTLPLASDLDWVAGATVPNLGVVKLGADGAVDTYNLSGATDAVVDVEGYYTG
jgi:hypothetical protein